MISPPKAPYATCGTPGSSGRTPGTRRLRSSPRRHPTLLWSIFNPPIPSTRRMGRYLHPVLPNPWPPLLLSFLLLPTTSLSQPLAADSLAAPNGALHLRLWLDAQGVPTYTVTHGAERVHLVAPSRLGVEANSERSFGLRRGLSRPSFSRRTGCASCLSLPEPPAGLRGPAGRLSDRLAASAQPLGSTSSPIATAPRSSTASTTRSLPWPSRRRIRACSTSGLWSGGRGRSLADVQETTLFTFRNTCPYVNMP